MRSACLVLLLCLRPSLAAQCSTDGSQYSYSESVNAATNTRTITESGCPSHVWTNINPNYPVASSSTWKVPSQPMYDPASEISLSSQGGATGILFSATQVYSAFGGPRIGDATSYGSGAPFNEGDTFDECGGHASSTTQSSYHVHVPPTCLLSQLGADNSQHSPQIGWSFDGFPIYGPRGDGGALKKTCTIDPTQDKCLDDCAGLQGTIDLDGAGTSDGYTYRYYIMGEKSSSTTCSEGDYSCAEFWPHTPICMKGCLPSSASGSGYFSALQACSSSAQAGYTTVKPAVAPGLSFMASPTCPASTDVGCTGSKVSGAAQRTPAAAGLAAAAAAAVALGVAAGLGIM